MTKKPSTRRIAVPHSVIELADSPVAVGPVGQVTDGIEFKVRAKAKLIRFLNAESG